MIRKVCFAFIGPLKYRGRLFKQIETLRNAGMECTLIHGRTEDTMPDYTAYPFPILPIRVSWERSKLLTFATTLMFNWRAAQLILKHGFDVAVCISLESALCGALAKKKRNGIRFVYDSNELSLEMISSWLKRQMWAPIQNYVLKTADVVMHAEKHRLDYFVKKYPSKARPFLLENLPHNRPLHRRPRTGPLRVVYIGVLSPDRFCVEMLAAFAAMKPESVSFDMIGYYGRKEYAAVVEARLSALGASNVRVLPAVPHGAIYDALESYDVGLAFYENSNLNNYYCAPNKVYDYIQMGLAVITNRYPGLVDIVEGNRIGVCLDMIDAENLRMAIRRIEAGRLFDNIGDSIRRRYSWEFQSDAYKQTIALENCDGNARESRSSRCQGGNAP